MAKPRLKGDTQAALFNARLKVLSLYQLPHASRRRVEPGDPWIAALYNGGSVLLATKMLHGAGSTPDDAVRAALGTMARLETEIDKLLAVLRGLR